MKKFQNWAKREYSIRQRLIALGFEGIFFVLIFPFLLVVSSAAIDRWLQLPRFTLSELDCRSIACCGRWLSRVVVNPSSADDW